MVIAKTICYYSAIEIGVAYPIFSTKYLFVKMKVLPWLKRRIWVFIHNLGLVGFVCPDLKPILCSHKTDVMNKKIYSLFAALIFAAVSFAQTSITNGDFELWDNGSGTTAEPSNWNSNKTGAGNASSGPQTCFREGTNVHGGTYCARIVTGKVAVIGTIVNGSLTTGRVEAPSFSKSDGFIGAYSTNAGTVMPFTGRPDSIVFWIRYTANSSSDFPRVEARLHVDSCFAPEAATSYHPNAAPKVIARAQYTGTGGASIANWTRIALPFTYVDNRTPQYILITSTSSGDQSGGAEGSTMWLDDFSVIYNPTIATGTVNAGPYYVSNTTGAAISVPFTLTGTFNAGNVVTAELSPVSGTFGTPVSLGTSTTTTSGTVSGTIPAGTATGSVYKVRVTSSNPALTATPDVTNVNIVLVSSSIAPNTAQTIAANTNGTQLTVAATNGATSREWKYTTTSGSGYQSFAPAATATTYTPNFANAGTYYIVCESTYPGGVVSRSNEVRVNVVKNSIAPASPQSILTNNPGTQLTVTETPAGTVREWKFTTTSGSNYQSFAPTQTNSTYTPQFAAPGTYYVVCQSTISGVTVTSNEVSVSVGSVTLQTTSVTNFPIDFSPNAPNKSVTVNYTVTGGSFNGGNTFTAQLSDKNGSFASPVTIGSTSSTTSGSINATVVKTTPSGIGYRVRVIGSNPAISGSDNGSDLIVDQFTNSIAPATKQTLQYGASGNFLTVNESQNTNGRTWKFGTSATGPFQAFAPNETGASYTPVFATPGTYFVVCVSKNVFNDTAVSNAVEFEVTNGTQLSTTSVTGTPFLISPKANAQGTVSFTSNIIFNAGNVFTAELSDASGSFANPTSIGSLNGINISPISVTIPNNIAGGTGYKMRVVSSDPAATGTPSSAVTVIPFSNSVTPSSQQTAQVGVPATTLTVAETHTATGREWFVTFSSGAFYNAFSPKELGQTISPVFLGAGTAYVICRSVNAANDTVTSAEVAFVVEDANAINELDNANAKVWFNANNLVVSLNGKSDNYQVKVFTINGSLVAAQQIQNDAVSTVDCGSIAAGNYIVQLTANGFSKQFKLMKP